MCAHACWCCCVQITFNSASYASLSALEHNLCGLAVVMHWMLLCIAPCAAVLAWRRFEPRALVGGGLAALATALLVLDLWGHILVTAIIFGGTDVGAYSGLEAALCRLSAVLLFCAFAALALGAVGLVRAPCGDLPRRRGGSAAGAAYHGASLTARRHARARASGDILCTCGSALRRGRRHCPGQQRGGTDERLRRVFYRTREIGSTRRRANDMHSPVARSAADQMMDFERRAPSQAPAVDASSVLIGTNGNVPC